MTQKEQIRQEIDTRRQHMVEELMGHEENCEYHRIKGMHDAYVDLLTFLDYSLPEEKLSYVTDSPGDPGNPGEPGISDLEEAAEEYLRNVQKIFLNTLQHPNAKECFIAGAEWQKEQMMKEAVEGFIFQSEDYYPKELVAQYNGELKHGEKVKIIIVKQ